MKRRSPTSHPTDSVGGLRVINLMNYVILGVFGRLFYTFHFYLIKNMEVAFISKPIDKKFENLVNEEIENEVLLVISDTGEQLGELSRLEALKVAEEKGLDLVCVAPNSKIPVCKLMEYSKYRYEQIKKAKEAKKNQKIVEVKEIRLSPTIDKHDFDTKIKAAIKFLNEGNKIKVSCRFRGRMIEQANSTKGLFNTFVETIDELAQVDQKPFLDGRNLFMMLSPKVQKKNK